MCYRRRAVFTTCGHTSWGAVMHGSWPNARQQADHDMSMDSASQAHPGQVSSAQAHRASYRSTTSTASAQSATSDHSTTNSLSRPDQDTFTKDPAAQGEHEENGEELNGDRCVGRNKSHPYLTVWIDGLCRACEARRSILLTRLADEEMDDLGGGGENPDWGKDVELAFELDRRSSILFSQSQSSRSSQSVRTSHMARFSGYVGLGRDY